jgi:hypothetical protein
VLSDRVHLDSLFPRNTHSRDLVGQTFCSSHGKIGPKQASSGFWFGCGGLVGGRASMLGSHAQSSDTRLAASHGAGVHVTMTHYARIQYEETIFRKIYDIASSSIVRGPRVFRGERSMAQFSPSMATV